MKVLQNMIEYDGPRYHVVLIEIQVIIMSSGGGLETLLKDLDHF